jgi:hypothetical protein
MTASFSASAATVSTIDFDAFTPGEISGALVEHGYVFEEANNDLRLVDVGGGNLGLRDSALDYGGSRGTITRSNGGLFTVTEFDIVDIGGGSNHNPNPDRRRMQLFALLNDVLLAEWSTWEAFGFAEPTTLTTISGAALDGLQGVLMDELEIHTLSSPEDQWVLAQVYVESVPVPGTFGLLGLGALMLFRTKQRRGATACVAAVPA